MRPKPNTEGMRVLDPREGMPLQLHNHPITRPDEGRDAEARDRSRLYQTPAWRAMRARQLREHPLCLRCSERGIVTAATVADHRDGHAHPNWRLMFYRPDKLISLCAQCHNAKTSGEVRRHEAAKREALRDELARLRTAREAASR